MFFVDVCQHGGREVIRDISYLIGDLINFFRLWIVPLLFRI